MLRHKSYTVEIMNPTRTMQRVLDHNCDYRRYCWNRALETWNGMYDAYTLDSKRNPKPTKNRVQKDIMNGKQYWEYQYSSRILKEAVRDLGKAWQTFFKYYKNGWGTPSWKSKKEPHQDFKDDDTKLIKDGKAIRLPRPSGSTVSRAMWKSLRISPRIHKLPGQCFKTFAFYKEHSKYYAAIQTTFQPQPLPKEHNINAVDVNVGHFNYIGGSINTLPKSLKQLYKRIKHYQRVMAKKRNANGRQASDSKNYAVTRSKLQRSYRKAHNIQKDIIQKFTARLIRNTQMIVIEDLDVKKMQMSHVASKGLQRSLFGYFRQVLSYKCDWYGRSLIFADQTYPSTQRCNACGHIKQGDEKIGLAGNRKHHTRHDQYICYHCGFGTNFKKGYQDRDMGAVINLVQYPYLVKTGRYKPRNQKQCINYSFK